MSELNIPMLLLKCNDEEVPLLLEKPQQIPSIQSNAEKQPDVAVTKSNELIFTHVKQHESLFSYI